jgi:hypothetical protein
MNSCAQSSAILVYESRGGLLSQWIAEIDPGKRRLILFRRWFGRWDRTVIDCSLDDCVSLGTVEYSEEDGVSYGTYFKLRDGSWYAIPVKRYTFKEALKVVKQVSAATGIPRLDIKYS